MELHAALKFAQVRIELRSMLHSMQEQIASPTPQTAHDFAGLLAALAAAKSKELPAWNEEELPQDVAILSYERALRKHARYRSGDANGIIATQPLMPLSRRSSTAAQNETQPRSQSRPLRREVRVTPMSERDRKCSSVTIRMSQTECEQLRERAAEAGLTISAYLRSCTFEAEALRAQVKQALAELRSAHASKYKPVDQLELENASAAGNESSKNSSTHDSHSSRLGWLRRIIPDLRPVRSLVRA